MAGTNGSLFLRFALGLFGHRQIDEEGGALVDLGFEIQATAGRLDNAKISTDSQDYFSSKKPTCFYP